MVETLPIYTLKEDGASVSFPPKDAIPALPYDEQAVVGSYTFTAGRMGSVNIQSTLMYPVCLDNYWTGLEYVEFRGEKYWIFSTPTSSKANDDIRYKHELNFTSERIALDNTYFFDVVSPDATDVDQFVSNSTKFTFFGDIAEFVKRMNYSLQYSQLGYSVVIDEGVSSEAKLMSFEDKFFSDVLVEVFNTYELPFYFVGKVIHIGFTSNAITHPFRYGYDKELLSISKTNANYRIVNRCTGTGSSENIPFYYPNDSQKGTVLAVAGETNKGVLQDDLVISDQYLFQDKVSLNKKIEYKNAEKAFEPILKMKNVYYPSRRGEVPSISFSEYNGTVSTGRATTVTTENAQKRVAPISIMDTEEKKDGKTRYILHGRIYIFLDLEDDTEITATYSSYFRMTVSDIVYEGRGNSSLKLIYDSGDQYDKTNWHITEILSGINSIGEEEKETDILLDPIDSRHQSVKLTKGVHYLKIYSFYSLWLPDDYISTRNRPKRWDAQFTVSRPFVLYEKFDTWHYEDRRINLSDIGITIKDATPQVGDYFTQQQEEGSYYITSDKLMPPIYRESGGEERFYPAKNNTYISPETGEYYQFENEYQGNNPKEMIVSFDYIKPTIKNIANAEGLMIGEIVDVAFDDDDNDEFDDKQNKYEHEFFYIKLRRFDGNFGFNLFEQGIASNEMTISMTSGNCAACNFVIGVAEDEKGPNKFYNTVQVDESGNIVPGNYDQKVNNKNIIPSQQNTMTNEVWIAVKKDTDTFGTIMPSNVRNYKPKEGDSFVLINIDLPKAYILAAENELKEAIIKYMAANNSEKFNFSINFKRIFFAEYPEILAQLDENARLLIEYDGKEYTLYVSNYTYKVSNDQILPEISVELSDTITVKKGSLQKSIDAVKADIMTSIGSIDFLKMGLKYFIRKDTDDSANGHIVFKDGIFVTRGTEDDISDAVVLQEENNSIHEENNAIHEDTPSTIDVTPPVPADTTLGDLSNVKQLVDEPTIEDMVLAKLAGSTEWTQVKMPSGGGGETGGDSTYESSITNKDTTTNPSFKEIEGKRLSELEGKSFSDIFDMLFFTAVYPTFVAPSVTIGSTWGTNNSVEEVGTLAPAKSTFSRIFNRGAINIVIDGVTVKQADRAGQETSTTYTCNGSTTFPSTLAWGAHTYRVVVNYAIGAQPIDSKGNPYGSPLPAGSVSADFVVYGGRPCYLGGTKVYGKGDIISVNKSSIVYTFRSETSIGRWLWKIPKEKIITKIEYYDTNSGKWVNDKLDTNWDLTSESIDGVAYWKLTNINPTMRGSMELRITLTNA